MQTHYLKTWPAYFARVRSGEKPFEVRKNDRDFQTGDTLVLQEFDPNNPLSTPQWNSNGPGYTGSELRKRVTYTLHGGQFGIEPGHVVLGLEDADDPDAG
jgi:hypothetical protein